MADFPIDLPERTLAKAVKLSVFPHDVEESFVRGGGAGGQKINKTSSCVWLRHAPSGVEVKCQRHREQSKNRVSAYKLLIEKIEEKKLGAASERVQKLFKLRKQKARRSRKAKERMLEGKRRRSEVKRLRGGAE